MGVGPVRGRPRQDKPGRPGRGGVSRGALRPRLDVRRVRLPDEGERGRAEGPAPCEPGEDEPSVVDGWAALAPKPKTKKDDWGKSAREALEGMLSPLGLMPADVFFFGSRQSAVATGRLTQHGRRRL